MAIDDLLRIGKVMVNLHGIATEAFKPGDKVRIKDGVEASLRTIHGFYLPTADFEEVILPAGEEFVFKHFMVGVLNGQGRLVGPQFVLATRVSTGIDSIFDASIFEDVYSPPAPNLAPARTACTCPIDRLMQVGCTCGGS
jgi:hypothetical protein